MVVAASAIAISVIDYGGLVTVMTIAMEPWIILTIGVSIGIVLGTVVAAICLVERPQWWTIILRLPKGLHRRLRHDAKGHMQSLSSEIISRLRQSVDDDHPER
jgi:hypothetical protein